MCVYAFLTPGFFFWLVLGIYPIIACPVHIESVVSRIHPISKQSHAPIRRLPTRVSIHPSQESHRQAQHRQTDMSTAPVEPRAGDHFPRRPKQCGSQADKFFACFSAKGEQPAGGVRTGVRVGWMGSIDRLNDGAVSISTDGRALTVPIFTRTGQGGRAARAGGVPEGDGGLRRVPAEVFGQEPGQAGALPGACVYPRVCLSSPALCQLHCARSAPCCGCV